jgi:hypothetical protein
MGCTGIVGGLWDVPGAGSSLGATSRLGVRVEVGASSSVGTEGTPVPRDRDHDGGHDRAGSRPANALVVGSLCPEAL